MIKRPPTLTHKPRACPLDLNHNDWIIAVLVKVKWIVVVALNLGEHGARGDLEGRKCFRLLNLGEDEADGHREAWAAHRMGGGTEGGGGEGRAAGGLKGLRGPGARGRRGAPQHPPPLGRRAGRGGGGAEGSVVGKAEEYRPIQASKETSPKPQQYRPQKNKKGGSVNRKVDRA